MDIIKGACISETVGYFKDSAKNFIINNIKKDIQEQRLINEINKYIYIKTDNCEFEQLLFFDSEKFKKNINNILVDTVNKLPSFEGDKWKDLKDTAITRIVEISFIDITDTVSSITDNKNEIIKREKNIIRQLSIGLLDVIYYFKRKTIGEDARFVAGELGEKINNIANETKNGFTRVEDRLDLLIGRTCANSLEQITIKKNIITQLQFIDILPQKLRDIVGFDKEIKEIVFSIFSSDLERVYKTKPYFFTDDGFDEIEIIKERLDAIQKLVPEGVYKTGINPFCKEVALAIIVSLIQDISLFISKEVFFSLIQNCFSDEWVEFIYFLRKQPIWNVQKLVGSNNISDMDLKCLLQPSLENFEENQNINKLVAGAFIQKYKYIIISELIRNNNLTITDYKVMELKGDKDEIKNIKTCVEYVFNNMEGDYRKTCLTDINNYSGLEKDAKLLDFRILYTLVLVRIVEKIVLTKKIINEEDLFKFFINERQIFIKKKINSFDEYENIERCSKGIQDEIDKGNSVLCQYYYDTNSVLLSVLYVDLKMETKHLPFSPKPTKMQADGSVFPLFIDRIYDDDFIAAIREIISNSIDACYRKKIFADYDAHIDISFNSKTGELTVSDNGIGMDEEFIREFFLSVGKSYYNSNSWREIYKNDNGEDSIPHIGCYGIGKLSYLMLSKKYTVNTFSYNDNKNGWSFDIDYLGILTSKNIELKKLALPNNGKKKKSGTTIILVVEDELTCSLLRSEISWMNIIDIESKEICIQCLIDGKPFSLNNDNVQEGWFLIRKTKEFEIYASFDKASKSSVNGIVVPDDRYACKFKVKSYSSSAFVEVTREYFSDRFITIYDNWIREVIKNFASNLVTYPKIINSLYFKNDLIGMTLFPKTIGIELSLIKLLKGTNNCQYSIIDSIEDLKDFIQLNLKYLCNPLDFLIDLTEVEIKEFVMSGNYCFSFVLKDQMSADIVDVVNDNKYTMLNIDISKYNKTFYSDIHNFSKQIKCFDVKDKILKIGENFYVLDNISINRKLCNRVFTTSMFRELYYSYDDFELMDDDKFEKKYMDNLYKHCSELVSDLAGVNLKEMNSILDGTFD